MRLTEKMEKVFLLKYADNLKEVEIAQELGVTKQAVNKTLKEAKSRLAQMFIQIAEMFAADIVRINIEKCYAIYFSAQTGKKIYAFYIFGKGPRILLNKDIKCNDRLRTFCKEITETAKLLGIVRDKENVSLKTIIEKIEE